MKAKLDRLYREMTERAMVTGSLSFLSHYSRFPLREMVSLVNACCRLSWPPYLFGVHKVKKITVAEIQEMAENNLLVARRKKRGKTKYHIMNVLRILFIKVLQEKFGVPVERIRQMTQFETRTVIRLARENRKDHSPKGDYSVLGIFHRGVHESVEFYEKNVRGSPNVTPALKTEWELEIGDCSSLQVRVEGKKWRELEPEEARLVLSWALGFVGRKNESALFLVSAYQDMMLQGYSPQVAHTSYSDGTDHHVVLIGSIAWERSLSEIEATPWLSYFRTPDFEVELANDQIDIRVFNPKVVGSEVIRQIEKVYNIFRKRIGRERAPYGKKTQFRREKEKLYEFVRDTFWKMRRESQLKVPDIFDEIRKKGVSLSDDSFKRIVYGLKKKG